jgi:two-component system aerobic respiration control sensor histidine kinase ArcB
MSVKQLQNQVNHLEKIISLMPGHVYWLDTNNIYQGCNDLQAQSVKLSSRKDIIGKTNYDLIWRDYASELDKINQEVMLSGHARISEEEAITAQGKGIFLSQKVPLYNEDNEVIGLLGVSFDITDRKKTEQALKVAKEKAEIANQVKTEFMRNMEHDIRTPISGILGVSSYLKEHQKLPEHKELLSDIENASGELLDYLNNILEFSQLTKDVLPVILKELSIQEIIQSIFKIELPAAKHKQLRLEAIYGADLPETLIGDTFRIYRMLLNLVSNAIKFTEKGKISVEVNVVSQEKNNLLLQIVVRDTGIGIPQNQQVVIFDKFTRCLPSNKGTYKGTGVGLWVVKQFVNELDGSIELESVVGEGSTFTVTLPMQIP